MPLQLHVAENYAVVAAEALYYYYWLVNLPMEVNNYQSSDSSESQIQEDATMQVLDLRTGMLEPTLAQNASTRHH